MINFPCTRLPSLRSVRSWFLDFMYFSNLIHCLAFHALFKLTPIFGPVCRFVLLSDWLTIDLLINFRFGLRFWLSFLFLFMALNEMNFLRCWITRRSTKNLFCIFRTDYESTLLVMHVICKESLFLTNNSTSCKWCIQLCERNQIWIGHRVALEILENLLGHMSTYHFCVSKILIYF